MLRGSKDMTANTTGTGADKESGRRIIPTVTALSIGFALVAGWSISSGSAGCAGAYVVDPIRDFSTTNPTNDGGTTTTETRFTAAPSTAGAVLSDTPPLPAYQQWKRDPNFVLDGSDQYMYYAGSSYQTELWKLAVFKGVGNETPPKWANAATEVLPDPPAPWDTKDRFAPTVRVNPTGTPKFVMYYASNGDPSRPDYVTQIGRATSADGVAFTRSGTSPALAVPVFSGVTVNDSPNMQRPDAWGVTDPSVHVEGSNVILYYAGLDCAVGATGTCTYKIFRTVSGDGGMTFPPGEAVQLGTIPEAPGGVAGPSVVQNGNVYVLTFTTIAAPVTKSRLGVRQALTRGSIGIATGTDGKTFKYAGSNPTAPIVARGGSTYSEGAGASSLYVSGTSLKMYFCGLQELGASGTYFNLLPASIDVVTQ